MNITIWIIIATAAFSIFAFERRDIFERFLLSPYMVIQRKEWYRVITHGFLHSDWLHLIINMLVLYSFGRYIEGTFQAFTSNWVFHFLALYFGGMIVASVPSLAKYRNQYGYRSVGASGAVSAVLFAFIFFAPWEKILFMAVIPVPSIIFGVLYLAYSSYMGRKGGGNIDHDAHIWGAVFGFLYPLVIHPQMLQLFIHQLTHPF